MSFNWLFKISFSLVENIISRYFSVCIQIFLLEYYVTCFIDDVTKLVHKVSSLINSPVVFINKLLFFISENDVVATIIDIKLTHYVVEFKFRRVCYDSFLLPFFCFFPSQSSLWQLYLLVFSWSRHAINYTINQARCKVLFNFNFFFHNYFIVGVNIVFAFDPEQLS